MSASYLGIDPGLNGYLVVYSPSCRALDFYPMPTTMAVKRRALDKYELQKVIIDILDVHTIAMAVLEKAQPRPAGGGVASFALGVNSATPECFLIAQRVPYTIVPPTTWHKSLGIPKRETMGQRKAESRVQAQQLFPEYADDFSKAKDHDKAEAALLAYYASLYAREI